LVVAFTPTVGIQIPIVAVIWAALRTWRPTWNFNLIVAIAWTWTTNVFTVPPVYYVFFVTGRVMLGDHDRLPGYADFAAQIAASLELGDSIVAAMIHGVAGLLKVFGLPLFLGSVPWALVIGVLGYVWSLKFVRRHRLAREA